MNKRDKNENDKVKLVKDCKEDIKETFDTENTVLGTTDKSGRFIIKKKSNQNRMCILPGPSLFFYSPIPDYMLGMQHAGLQGNYKDVDLLFQLHFGKNSEN